LRVVHAVPDTLEDGSERCNTDTGTDKYGNFELEDILRGGTKGSVDVDSGKDLAHSDLIALFLAAFLATGFLVEVAAEYRAERLGEVTNHADMHRDVVLLRCAGQCERMVLPNGDFGAAQEDVL
jgi:hypothetical protein